MCSESMFFSRPSVRHGPQVRQRVEALTEFSRFALYKEFVCFLTLREIRKVRTPKFWPGSKQPVLSI